MRTTSLLFAFTTALAAGPALAQSSVTLSGTLDAWAGSRELSGGARSTRTDSGGLTTSQLNFSGTEDLGGGLKAEFVLGMFLAFGITFEVPVVVILLVRFGIVDIAKLKEARPYVIVGAFVVAAVVTPPDVLSQIMLAVPLWLLYELGIVLAAWLVKPAAKDATPDSPTEGDA